MLLPLAGWGQRSKKPQVLVYGYGVDAYTAALQSSMSNLNTVWVVNGDQRMPELTTDFVEVASADGLDAGIWADLLARTLKQTTRNDSVSTLAKRRINPQIVRNILDSVLGATNNLTVIDRGQLRSVKKSGKDWRIELMDKQRFDVRAVIDASADAYLFQLAKGSLDSIAVRTAVTDDYVATPQYAGLARTGVAVGSRAEGVFTLPLAGLVPADDGNLFLTRRLPVMERLLDGTADDVPLLMHVGQAVGASAAYTAFFKSTSDKLDVRTIQGELLQYGARLIPFGDVTIEHPHFAAIQRVGATGLLLGRTDATGRLFFSPDSTVTAAELKPVLNQLFSRSQIWFVNHASVDTLTFADLFSYIKFVGQRGNELEGQVQKYWKRRFRFEDDYDEQRLVTRRHVAVLLDAYCKPFEVKIGMDGTIHR